MPAHTNTSPSFPYDQYPLPISTPPMEATSVAQLPVEGEWQFEPKWDGFRCLVFKDADHVDLRAKSGKPLGRFFPEVVSLFQTLSTGPFVIDGELVIDVEGRLSFDALQMRLHPAATRIRNLSIETPARFVMFDILANPTDKVVIELPLRERRSLLDEFARKFDFGDLFEISPATRNRDLAKRWLADSGPNGTDGVIAKNLDMPYLPGERAMRKVKRLRTADCVVGGFRYENDSDKVGSLLLGLFNEEGRLDHVGYTSTITDEERPALTERLEQLRAPPGFSGKAPGGPSRWSTQRSGNWEPLKPLLVVEVRFDHVTGRRFRHGTKLVRWRPDKRPDQCTFEQMA